MSTVYCGDNCSHTGPHRYPTYPTADDFPHIDVTDEEAETLLMAIEDKGDRYLDLDDPATVDVVARATVTLDLGADSKVYPQDREAAAELIAAIRREVAP